MKNISRAWLILPLLFVCRPIIAQWLLPGQSDFTKAVTKVFPVRDNISLIQIRTPQQVFNTLVLAGHRVTCWWIILNPPQIRQFKKCWMIWESGR